MNHLFSSYSTLSLALVVLGPSLLVGVEAAVCDGPGVSQWMKGARLGPKKSKRGARGLSSCGAGLPYELSNFQGIHACNPSALIGTPADVEGLRRVVTSFPHVKAVGVGHNWGAGFFCPGNSSDSVGIVMTEIKDVRDMNVTSPDAPTFPIKVSADNTSVWVHAGVVQRTLLDFLAAYGSGYTLAAYPWYIDQTIGGAVATGSHGSSLRFGSLSSQVITFEVMLADGSVRNVTAADPHLFRAFKVSVGRLGIILRLQMRIVPDTAIRRTLTEITFNTFVAELKSFQTSLSAAVAANSSIEIDRVLHQLDETQLFWFVPQPNATVFRIDFAHLPNDPEEATLLSLADAEVQAFDGPSDDENVQPQRRGPRSTVHSNLFITRPGGASFFSTLVEVALRSQLANGTFPRRQAFISQTENSAVEASVINPYDQYEVSIPLEHAGDCLEKVGAEVYGPSQLWTGFRSPPLIRFVAAEDAYLSPTNGGPRMYMNLEDYLLYATNATNVPFQRTMSLLAGCPNARLHWGKAGWDNSTGSHNANFNGGAQYPDTWCHFGCAVAQLDPTAKFWTQSAYMWTFIAREISPPSAPVISFGGARYTAADASRYAAACCGPNGFIEDKCQCMSF